MIKTFGASAWRHDEPVPGTARRAVVVHPQVVPNLHDGDGGDGGDDDGDDDVDDYNEHEKYDKTS